MLLKLLAISKTAVDMIVLSRAARKSEIQRLQSQLYYLAAGESRRYPNTIILSRRREMVGGCWLSARPKFEWSRCTSIFSPFPPPHWGLWLPWSWDVRLDRSEGWVEAMYSEAWSELVWSMGLRPDIYENLDNCNPTSKLCNCSTPI